MALKEEVMVDLSYVNLEPRSLILTVLDPNIYHSSGVFVRPEVYLVLVSLLTTIHHNISNGMSD